MNALAILQHAYASIAKAFPDKTAFQIVEDVEQIASRIAAAAQVVDSALVAKAPSQPQG